MLTFITLSSTAALLFCAVDMSRSFIDESNQRGGLNINSLIFLR